MDPTRRDRLARKREEFRERLRRAEGEAAVGEELERLRAAGAEPVLLFDADDLVAWTWARFPRGGGLFSPRVDWGAVAGHRPGPGPEADDRAVSAWLRDRTPGTPPTTPVFLVPGNGTRPVLRVPLAVLLADPGVVSLQPEGWVLCPDGEWLVEYQRFGNGWNFGTVTPGNGGADQP